MITSVLTLPTPYYDKDGITIYCADCRSILPFLEPVDLVLTDPPYGIGADNPRGNTGKNKHILQRTYPSTNWDSVRGDVAAINHARQVSQDQVIWGGNYFADVLPASGAWFVWDKDNGENRYADCEMAWTSRDAAARLFRWKWHGFLQEPGAEKEDRQHPTQKPLKLMTWCLSFFPKAETILDPFMGSGTTLVAAKLLGKKAIGIEISEEYCRIAVERLAQGVMDFAGN